MTTATHPSPRTAAAAGSVPAQRTVRRPRRGSVTLTALTAIVLAYALIPLAWLVINASKTQQGLFNSFGLWFGGRFALFSNIADTLTYDNGVFVTWLRNTLLYVVLGAGGATF